MSSNQEQKKVRNTNTEIERADDNTFQIVSSEILPKAGEFLVSFPRYKNLPKKEGQDEDANKCILSNNDLQKIFGMVRKGPAETSP